MQFDEFVELVNSLGGSVSGTPTSWKSVKVDIRGQGSKFTFGNKVKVDSLSLTDYGGNNNFIIDDNSKFTGVIKCGKDCTLKIGKDFSSTGGLKIHLSEGENISIGNDCMFGVDVSIYNHDYHPIFDKDSGDRLNLSKSVTIEDHVWLANKVTVLKGVSIGKGAAIGLGSIVSSNIESNCVAVGIPAKVIKRNIIWDRASLNTSNQSEINKTKEIKK